MVSKSNVGSTSSMLKYLLSIAGALLLLGLTFIGYAAQSTKAQVEAHEVKLSTLEGVQQVEHKGIEKKLIEVDTTLKEVGKKQDKILELLGERNVRKGKN